MTNLITSASGKKQVQIKFNEYNGFVASYIQIYSNGCDNKNCQEVLDSKAFPTEKKAIAWANKKLA